MWKKRKTKHHRKALANGGSDSWDNISMVTEQKHRAFHLCFANFTPEQLAFELNRVWIDTDYVMIAVNRHKGVTVEQLLGLGNEVYRNEKTANR